MTPARVLSIKRIGQIVVLATALGGGEAAAQSAAPPPPKVYKAVIRYQIRAPLAVRIDQYQAMLRHFEALGFRKDEGADNEAEDPNVIRMSGSIPSANARQLLEDRRVRSILLMPAAYDLAANADKPVKIAVELLPGLPADRQSLLAEQVRRRLEELGFRAFVGYDHRGHTRLLGTLPADRAERLLEDLRRQGTGWLAPRVSVEDLPPPLGIYWPVRVIEVLPEPADFPPVREAAAEPAPATEDALKITPQVRALAVQADLANKPARLQVILSTTPVRDDPVWQRLLRQAAPGLAIEGVFGQIVSVLANPDQAAALAELSFVSTVRLPRSASLQVPTGETAHDAAAVLRELGIERWHRSGQRGRGMRLAIVDTDFRGYRKFVGTGLPADTRYLDLTAERSRDVLPEPFAGNPVAIGPGTHAALAAALAAPEASFTLIRIAADAPYQLITLARVINGEAVYSDSLDRRNEQLTNEVEALRQMRIDLLRERSAVLDNFRQDEETVKRRQAYFQKQAELDREEHALQGRQERYLQLIQDLQALKGTPIVANNLVWNEGYAADGTGPLARALEDLPFRGRWFQAAGDTRGQSWAGPFRDADKNGVLEFAGPGEPLRTGHWTRELNFLGWQLVTGPRTQELPAKATIRVSVQWTEPHDPEFLRRGEDVYRRPLADVRLLILRQRDPKGERVGSDELDVIAASAGQPQRLHNAASYATYEQTVEFTADSAGRYALRVEGSIPNSVRPANLPTLPSLQQSWELNPRVFLNVLDDASRAVGRPVFADYAPDFGNVGMPADANFARTVGAAGPNGEPRSYSATGPAFGRELLAKPGVLLYDGLKLPSGQAAYGTAPATGLAAGMAALFGGTQRTQAGYSTGPWRVQPGSLLRLP